MLEVNDGHCVAHNTTNSVNIGAGRAGYILTPTLEIFGVLRVEVNVKPIVVVEIAVRMRGQ